MGTAIKTTHCTVCGELTHMLGTGLCDNCWELDNRLRYALGSEKVRAWLVKRMMTENMAKAIIEMDNIAWSEGLGPTGGGCQADWEILVGAAEKVTVSSSYRSDWLRHRKKLLDKVDST